MGIFQGAADLTRIFLNDAMLNAPSTYGSNAAANATAYHAARDRMGLAGDAASVASWAVPAVEAVKGAKLAYGGAKLAYGAAKAVPAALRSMPAISDMAFQGARALGLVKGASRGEALARLGVEATPRALLPAFATAHPVLSTIGAAAFPAFVAQAHANRVGGDAPQIAQAAAVKPVADAVAAHSSMTPAEAAAVLTGNHTASADTPVTFESLARNLSASQGGKISLRQLQALGAVSHDITPTATRPVSAKDQAGGQLLANENQAFAQRQAAAQALMETDPRRGLALGKQAAAEHTKALQAIMGADPMKQMFADAAAQAQQEDQ